MVHSYCHFVNCFGFVFVGLFSSFPLLFPSPMIWWPTFGLCFHSFFFSVYLLYFFFPFPAPSPPAAPRKQGFVRAPAGGSENNQQVPLLTPQQACSLYGKRVGVCPGFGPQEWLRCFAHPLGGVACRSTPSTPLLYQALQKWQLGLLVSLHIWSKMCSNCACGYF